MRDFEGRTGVVTGAAGGMGAAAVRLFAERGARVVALDRRLEDLNGLAEAWRGEGLAVEIAGYDQGDPDSIAAVFEQVDGVAGGRLDFCFANAGYGRGFSVLEVLAGCAAGERPAGTPQDRRQRRYRSLPSAAEFDALARQGMSLWNPAAYLATLNRFLPPGMVLPNLPLPLAA